MSLVRHRRIKIQKCTQTNGVPYITRQKFPLRPVCGWECGLAASMHAVGERT